MNSEIKNQLDALVGKTKMYKKKEITIKSYKEVNSTIVIFTNSNSHAFTTSEINNFFNQLKEPVNHTPRIMEQKQNNLPAEKKMNTNEVVINGYQPSAENITLKSTLLSVLEELKTNATDESIKKSKAICDVANTMVNIQKAEIQMINAVKIN